MGSHLSKSGPGETQQTDVPNTAEHSVSVHATESSTTTSKNLNVVVDDQVFWQNLAGFWLYYCK